MSNRSNAKKTAVTKRLHGETFSSSFSKDFFRCSISKKRQIETTRRQTHGSRRNVPMSVVSENLRSTGTFARSRHRSTFSAISVSVCSILFLSSPTPRARSLFRCEYCGKGFLHQTQLYQHHKQRHSTENQQKTEDEPFNLQSTTNDWNENSSEFFF